MAAPKPTLLILHGGSLVPQSYAKLTAALRDAGFEVHIPRHRSVNQSRPPDADLATDTAQARAYAANLVEAGRQVAVLMHSYGGQVGTNALYGLGTEARGAKGLPGGISHLIYMAAYAQPEGKSMVDKVEEFGHMDRMHAACNFAEDKSVTPNFPKEGFIGEHFIDRVSPDEVEAYMNSFVVWNGQCMYQGISNTPAWRDGVEVGYIYTTGDLVVPVDYQRSMVDGIQKTTGKVVKTVELDSGHSPNLTATKEVVDAIVKLTSG